MSVRVKFLLCLSLIITALCNISYGQSKEYLIKKNQKLSKPSPFESIIDDPSNREIVYDDGVVVAFEPLRKQAPVHLLIVPKKRIPTINELDEEKVMIQLFRAAKHLAKEYGISETGYRLSVNTNEDAGQSVFHLHVHLLGGMTLGLMMDQTYQDGKND